MAEGMESAIFVVNKMIETDTVLQRLFGDKEVKVYPGFADEASEIEVSYPYIRYQFIPIVTRGLPYLRKDWCQYFVGDKDYANMVNCVERILYLLNLSTYESLDLPVKDYSGKYKIQELIASSGTIPNTPSQDLGVWEQGVSFSMRYVILHPSWGRVDRKEYDVDSLLQ